MLFDHVRRPWLTNSDSQERYAGNMKLTLEGAFFIKSIYRVVDVKRYASMDCLGLADYLYTFNGLIISKQQGILTHRC